MTLLGVDYGSRRIGLAISDEDERWAHPLETLTRDGTRDVVEVIAERAVERGVGGLVVGMPIDMSGEEGPAAKRARNLARYSERGRAFQFIFWDERLTTVEADRALRVGNVRGAERKARVDQAAAQALLQSYLDGKQGAAWTTDEADRIAETERKLLDAGDRPKSRGRRSRR